MQSRKNIKTKQPQKQKLSFTMTTISHKKIFKKLKPLKNIDNKMIIISEKRRDFPHESCVDTLILWQEDKDIHTHIHSYFTYFSL